jgi:hypothetical protein
MSLSASLSPQSNHPVTPPAMRAAASAYDRAHRLKLLAIAGLGGAGVAVAAATASGVAAFLLGRRLRRD